MNKEERYKAVLEILLRNMPNTDHTFIQLYKVTNTNIYVLYSNDSLTDRVIESKFTYLKRARSVFVPFEVVVGVDPDVQFDMRNGFKLPQFLLSMDDGEFELWRRLQ